MPKLIKDWNDLVGLESETHRLEIDVKTGNGWAYAKEYVSDDEYFLKNHYLSTHTFYGTDYQYYTNLLQSCGFDVVIDNWDKKK